ncbi:MAG: alpha/beta hydrolase [Hamadaea sp.]|uniref:alpha/beta fold hydrolase n=1 Tax=Hamadaea sp. TaxID=2024425 RepID=UPI0017C4ECD4|nr:alpha/beta hydrolase [Hamadaea sp.]NUR69627.1 alpha/beta hydrolase [Hamadaea sp.]NUT23333.1 alpha/beta hydrolase [Hamadaea sp.]
MTEFLDVTGGRIAYDVVGEGPLVVLAHGLGDNREAFRFLVPILVDAGYRVVNADLRGHGESSTGWASYSRMDTAQDFIALLRHLGEPAIFIGHSFAGAVANIIAADAPELVRAIVEIDPGTRKPTMKFGDLNGRFMKGISLILLSMTFKSTGLWKSYLRHAYPGTTGAAFEEQLAKLERNLKEPGRMTAAAKMGFASAADAGAKLPHIQRPALVVMGTLDPDFPNPAAEAAGIVAEMPAGLGSVELIEGAGHYPHTQMPERVAEVILAFLGKYADA